MAFPPNLLLNIMQVVIQGTLEAWGPDGTIAIDDISFSGGCFPAFGKNPLTTKIILSPLSQKRKRKVAILYSKDFSTT